MIKLIDQELYEELKEIEKIIKNTKNPMLPEYLESLVSLFPYTENKKMQLLFSLIKIFEICQTSIQPRMTYYLIRGNEESINNILLFFKENFQS